MENKSALPPKQAKPVAAKPPAHSSSKPGEESIMALVGGGAASQPSVYETYKDKSVEELEALLDQYKKGTGPDISEVPKSTKLPTNNKEPIRKTHEKEKPQSQQRPARYNSQQRP